MTESFKREQTACKHYRLWRYYCAVQTIGARHTKVCSSNMWKDSHTQQSISSKIHPAKKQIHQVCILPPGVVENTVPPGVWLQLSGSGDQLFSWMARLGIGQVDEASQLVDMTEPKSKLDPLTLKTCLICSSAECLYTPHVGTRQGGDFSRAANYQIWPIRKMNPPP